MPTDTRLVGEAAERYRPAAPTGGPSRWLRCLAGVSESLLDWVPEERPRYTRLGAIILNTGLLGALSMLVALGKVLDTAFVALIPAVAFWAYLIISFDGWLVASTHGVIGKAKFAIFVPRLLLSILIGAVIAEPLVLWVFQPAVTKEVRQGRLDELNEYESQFKRCNPPDGGTLVTPDCADYILNLPNSPVAIRTELDTTTRQRDQLRTEVAGINADLAKKQDDAAKECAGGGTVVDGFSGRPGAGFRCRRLWDEADMFRTDSQLEQRQAALTELELKVADLTGKLKTAEIGYHTELNAAISAKVDKKGDTQESIGLLEEMAALERLSGESLFVFVGQWLVRLLLIAIDCLPALAKMLGGVTHYDRLVARQVEAGRRMHEKDLDLQERRQNSTIELGKHETAHDLRTGMERIDAADRAARADREAGRAAEIAKLAARLRQP